MAWVFLVIAGFFEMFGVAMIHRWNQNRNWKSISFIIVGFGASFLFLAFAMESLPMGIAYAVWTGIGASGGAVIGMLIYGEPKEWRRIIFIFMILSATVGLKLVS
ncbi:DMT family transporter [Caldalkalibacillus mannanilyticus]|uniref:DMT family transporter n=1 Tax=Caldalkalibacillus mannanilyticus TaxID=1418 RepID=UPI0004695144|nr:multidrug efflux SMR transporter [Caldalkalibacillus mannanilyticus]